MAIEIARFPDSTGVTGDGNLQCCRGNQGDVEFLIPPKPREHMFPFCLGGYNYTHTSTHMLKDLKPSFLHGFGGPKEECMGLVWVVYLRPGIVCLLSCYMFVSDQTNRYTTKNV